MNTVQEQEERRNDPNKYPYFAYYQFGFHRMTYLTEEEVQEEVKFYHLKYNGKNSYFRFGRQPIIISKRTLKGEFKNENR